ncbi:MAG: WbqC family protein [Candidatus Omnitrophica bacterium]|nr:WbqC family protein [Candidatus Omnitrophota bacterium]
MIVSVHQPQYIPWLGYFDKIDKSDCFVFLDTVQYKKREYQNRNRVRTKDSWIWLTVPVITKGSSHQSLSDVLIDNETDWANEHCKSLQSWYGHASYFKDYFPFFEDLYKKNWEKLIDLNINVIKYLLGALNIDTQIYLESEIGTSKKSTERIIEICQKLKADKYLSGAGGKDYLQEGLFAKDGIDLKYQIFEHPNYKQQFMSNEHAFESYMSVLDLLFNAGKQSLSIIRNNS